MGLPKINEVGRLWGDVELRFTPAGKAVASVPVVFNKRVKDQAGNWQDAGSLFVRGTAWEDLGEHCAESLSKGDEVLVQGELSMREYEAKDGSKGQSLELRIYSIGPSLSRATAKVTKAQRGSDAGPAHGRSGTSSSAPSSDPWGDVPPPAEELPPF